MHKTRLISSLTLLLFFSISVKGQYYSSGQDPFKVKWSQIKTEHFQVIYPKSSEAKAQYVANLMELVYPKVGYTLNEYPKRLPLILHEFSASSNAFVAWAPKRMEFYSVPPQDAYAQPWLDQLALHEQRHTVQISKMYQGTGKVFSWLLGQQGPIAFLGLYVPFWFLEGDATVIETAQSNSGRGRTPYFENIMRAQILDKGLYSYDKAMFRSYRDNVPDQYVYGYHFIAQSRKIYGFRLWDHTLDVVAKKAYMIVPFNHGIKQVTGLSKTELYKETFNKLKEEWKQQKELTNITYHKEISPRRKAFYDYKFPTYFTDSIVLTRRSSIDDITRFISVTPGTKDKVIFTPGSSNGNMLSYANGKIYWSESEPDPRWQNRSYSVIKEYNIATGKRRKLSRKSRYYVPAISPDGTKIAAIDVDEQDQYSLVILKASDGNLLNRISTDDNTFFMTPRWSDDNITVTAILMNRQGKSLAVINSQNGIIESLTPFDFTEISNPMPVGDKIFFTGAYNGIDNIYVLKKKDKSIYQLTSSIFGATNANVSDDGKNLLYSEFTSNGYRVLEMPMDSALWMPLNSVQNHSIKLYEAISQEEGWVLDDIDVPDSTFETGRFRRMPHLFNIHSWAPFSLDVSSYELDPGLMFLSQNQLSTSFLVAGYAYNINEETGKVYLKYSYEGFYPIIDLDVDYGKRRGQAVLENGQIFKYEWMETNIGSIVRVPLSLTRGKYYKGLTPSITFDQKFLSKIKPNPDIFQTTSISTMGYCLYAYHQLRTSVRDLYPKWGQIIDFCYNHSLFSDDQSDIIAINTYWYLPGIINHHGLRLYAAYQQREIDQYKFGDRIAYPRGISQMQDEELLSLSATYKLPVWYTDWSLPPVLYLKRIKLALFYDYAIGRNAGRHDTYYRTAGIDLTGDMHILRFLAPFDLGVRAIYLFDENTVEYQFLINISFDSFYVGQSEKQAGKIY